MYNLSVFINILFSLTPIGSISSEKFVNQLIEPLVSKYGIVDKKGERYYLSKTRVSELIHGQRDVPSKLRQVLGRIGVREVITEGLRCFLEDTVTISLLPQAIKEIDLIVRKDSTLAEEDLRELSSLIDNPIEYLAYAYIIALRTNNKTNDRLQSGVMKGDLRGNRTILRSRNSNSVGLVIGDLFMYEVRDVDGYKNFIVIPVNTAFDTVIDFNAEKDPFPIVSETTIHGQWIKRITQKGMALSDIDARIDAAIHTQGLNPIGTSITGYGKINRYSIGAIVPFETDQCIYLLLAVSAFQERNEAHTTKADLKSAFQKLLEYYNASGQGYKLYMPAVGTGRSRAKLSIKESIDLFLAVVDKNPKLLVGNINIVVREADVLRIS